MEGVSRYIFETTKRMVLNNPDVEFHFLFDRAYDERFIFSENVIPHVLVPQARHPILWYIWFEHAVPRILKKYNIDVFYSGDMWLSLKTKIPTLLVSHDLNYIHYPEGVKWSHLKFLNYFFPRYHKRANHIMTVSQYSKQDIIKQYKIDADKITVAYNALPDNFHPMHDEEKAAFKNAFTDGQDYFVYIGSMHPRKNLKRLLLAFALYKQKSNSNDKLVLFGRLAFKNSNLFSAYDALDCKEDIVFLNDDNCKISEALGAAEALCYVSLFEGFGIPILEAFKSEVPVITSNITSMPEVSGNAAILIDPNSEDDISNAMLSIRSEKEIKNSLVEKGKIRLNDFSWETSSELIFDCLKKISKTGRQ